MCQLEQGAGAILFRSCTADFMKFSSIDQTKTILWWIQWEVRAEKQQLPPERSRAGDHWMRQGLVRAGVFKPMMNQWRMESLCTVMRTSGFSFNTTVSSLMDREQQPGRPRHRHVGVSFRAPACLFLSYRADSKQARTFPGDCSGHWLMQTLQKCGSEPESCILGVKGPANLNCSL